jgi:hypothetical protein
MEFCDKTQLDSKDMLTEAISGRLKKVESTHEDRFNLFGRRNLTPVSLEPVSD